MRPSGASPCRIARNPASVATSPRFYATLLAHHLTGEARWERWHARLHEWAYRHFPDPKAEVDPLVPYGSYFRVTLAQMFLRAERNLAGKSVDAYATDLRQFFVWLLENNATATAPELIERADVEEYLAYLA